MGNQVSDDTSVKLGTITVHYGKTTVQELLDQGYTISNFEQILEEPTVANCSLNKDDIPIAILCFYEIKEKINEEQLCTIPINLVLLEDKRRVRYNQYKKRKETKRPLGKKILYTCLIHAAGAVLFMATFAIPKLFTYIRDTEVRLGGGRAPLGIVVIVLPSLFLAFLWGEGLIGTKGMIGKKLLFSLWIFFNVGITIAYIAVISMFFKDWINY